MQPENDTSQESNRRGKLTATIGKWLRNEPRLKDYTVYYDHGSEDKGRIVCWFGKEEPDRYNRLSFPDIVIAQGDRVLVLIEIEETTDRPKTLLADAFGILMGDHIRCHGQDLAVSTGTTLIVMGKGTGGQHDSMEDLRQRIENTQPCLGSKNASIGKIVLDTFAGDDDLRRRLWKNIAIGPTDTNSPVA